MSRSLLASAVIATALGTATITWLALGPGSPASVTNETAEGDLSRVKAPRRARTLHRDLRPRIQEEEERALPGLRSAADVDAYLDRLEQRARAQGQVTAVEIEPGMTAIFGLRDAVPEGQMRQMADDWDARMQALSAELGAPPRELPPRFEDALAAVPQADDPQARQAAIRDALDALESLPEAERFAAEERLDAALADDATAPTPAEDPETLHQAIEQTSDESSRQDAVRRYVQAVENLPPEQADELLERLESGDLPGADPL